MVAIYSTGGMTANTGCVQSPFAQAQMQVNSYGASAFGGGYQNPPYLGGGGNYSLGQYGGALSAPGGSGGYATSVTIGGGGYHAPPPIDPSAVMRENAKYDGIMVAYWTMLVDGHDLPFLKGTTTAEKIQDFVRTLRYPQPHIAIATQEKQERSVNPPEWLQEYWEVLNAERERQYQAAEADYERTRQEMLIAQNKARHLYGQKVTGSFGQQITATSSLWLSGLAQKVFGGGGSP